VRGGAARDDGTDEAGEDCVCVLRFGDIGKGFESTL